MRLTIRQAIPNIVNSKFLDLLEIYTIFKLNLSGVQAFNFAQIGDHFKCAYVRPIHLHHI